MKVIHVADKSVMILALPESSRPAKSAADFKRGATFPGFQNVGQLAVVDQFDEDMDVIGHHAPFDQIVSTLVFVD